MLIRGILLGFGIALMLGAFFICGYFAGKKARKPAVKETMTEEQKRKQKQITEDYNKMMNYNMETALGGSR